MIEITNKQRGPISVMVRSVENPMTYTSICVPGIGNGKNVVTIADERMTEIIDQLRKDKLITYRYVN